jgi:murein DD-endopeptidase MepM/ murein hydrolase activator NlpD
MQIEIHVPRPGITLLAVLAISGWGMYWMSSGGAQVQPPTAQVVQMHTDQGTVAAETSSADPQGHSEEMDTVIPGIGDASTGLNPAEMRIKWTQAEQEFLRNRETIVRAQLSELQKEREALGDTVDPALEEQFRSSVRLLTSLLQDQQKGEQFLLLAYRQMWEAEEKAMAIPTPEHALAQFTPLWPVEPALGISAYFLDEGYKQRFKVDHYAVDIPVNQGSVVAAAADGLVRDVVDHGLGYSYMTIDHGGYVTVYGHLSRFDVTPGQRVRAGERIGLSGGTPGLPGGGSSTGPHLHFGVYKGGKPVDPLKYLPKR